MRQILFFYALAATFLCISAAPKSFTVQAPGWSKVAVCDTEGGVNIRKSPSTSAPKYISRCDNPDEYWNTTGLWSASSLKKNDMVVKFNGMDPIISEQNGWYELYGIGPDGSNGWVSAQYCEAAQPKPLRPGQYNAVDFVWLKDTGGSDCGNYAIYCDFNDRYGTAVFYVGREINGVLVCPYLFGCQTEYNPDETPGVHVSHGRFDDGEEWTRNTFTYGSNESTQLGFDLSKFTVKALESIVDAAEKMDKPAYVYRMNGVYFLSGGIIND